MDDVRSRDLRNFEFFHCHRQNDPSYTLVSGLFVAGNARTIQRKLADLDGKMTIGQAICGRPNGMNYCYLNAKDGYLQFFSTREGQASLASLTNAVHAALA